VIHRDLKAENVLFASKYHAKVGDFGFSTVVTNGALLDIFCGSPPYAALELFREEKYDSMQVDICMGSGCHAILHDDWDHPFKGDTIDDVVPKIESVDYEIPKGLSVESISLMRGMLKYNFRLRYSGRAVDVIRSLWLTSITNKVIEVATDDIEVVDITREPVIALNNNDWNASQQATTEILQLMKE
jgi:serine/threonine protein kinase